MGLDGDRELGAALAARMAETPFYRWAGITLVSSREGEVELALKVEPHHLNLQGLVHGGMIATLADTAGGLAVRTALEPGRRHVTAQFSVDFFRPARAGRILATGRAVRVGSAMAFAEAEVRDERGRLLARATSVLSVTAER